MWTTPPDQMASAFYKLIHNILWRISSCSSQRMHHAAVADAMIWLNMQMWRRPTRIWAIWPQGCRAPSTWVLPRMQQRRLQKLPPPPRRRAARLLQSPRPCLQQLLALWRTTPSSWRVGPPLSPSAALGAVTAVQQQSMTSQIDRHSTCCLCSLCADAAMSAWCMHCWVGAWLSHVTWAGMHRMFMHLHRGRHLTAATDVPCMLLPCRASDVPAASSLCAQGGHWRPAPASAPANARPNATWRGWRPTAGGPAWPPRWWYACRPGGSAVPGPPGGGVPGGRSCWQLPWWPWLRLRAGLPSRWPAPWSALGPHNAARHAGGRHCFLAIFFDWWGICENISCKYALMHLLHVLAAETIVWCCCFTGLQARWFPAAGPRQIWRGRPWRAPGHHAARPWQGLRPRCHIDPGQGHLQHLSSCLGKMSVYIQWLPLLPVALLIVKSDLVCNVTNGSCVGGIRQL